MVSEKKDKYPLLYQILTAMIKAELMVASHEY